MSDENDGADDKISLNTVCVKMTGEENKNRSMDVWPNYSVSAQIEKN